jgi:hypothetical protein
VFLKTRVAVTQEHADVATGSIQCALFRIRELRAYNSQLRRRGTSLFHSVSAIYGREFSASSLMCSLAHRPRLFILLRSCRLAAGKLARGHSVRVRREKGATNAWDNRRGSYCPLVAWLFCLSRNQRSSSHCIGRRRDIADIASREGPVERVDRRVPVLSWPAILRRRFRINQDKLLREKQNRFMFPIAQRYSSPARMMFPLSLRDRRTNPLPFTPISLDETRRNRILLHRKNGGSKCCGQSVWCSWFCGFWE